MQTQLGLWLVNMVRGLNRLTVESLAPPLSLLVPPTACRRRLSTVARSLPKPSFWYIPSIKANLPSVTQSIVARSAVGDGQASPISKVGVSDRSRVQAAVGGDGDRYQAIVACNLPTFIFNIAVFITSLAYVWQYTTLYPWYRGTFDTVEWWYQMKWFKVFSSKLLSIGFQCSFLITVSSITLCCIP